MNLQLEDIIEVYFETLNQFDKNVKKVYKDIKTSKLFVQTDKEDVDINKYLNNSPFKNQVTQQVKRHFQQKTNSSIIKHFNNFRNSVLLATVVNTGATAITLNVLNSSATMPQSDIIHGEPIFNSSQIYVVIDEVLIKNFKPVIVCTRISKKFTINYLLENGIDRFINVERIPGIISVVKLEESISEDKELEMCNKYERIMHKEKLIFISQDDPIEAAVKKILCTSPLDYEYVNISMDGDESIDVSITKGMDSLKGKIIGKGGVKCRMVNKITNKKVNIK